MGNKFFVAPRNYHAVLKLLGENLKSVSSAEVYDSRIHSDVSMTVVMVDCEKIAENVHCKCFPDRKFDLFEFPDGRRFVYTKDDGTFPGPINDRWSFDPKFCESKFFENDTLALESALGDAKDKEIEMKKLEYVLDVDTLEFFCQQKSNKVFLGQDWKIRKIKKYPVLESTAPAKVY